MNRRRNPEHRDFTSIANELGFVFALAVGLFFLMVFSPESEGQSFTDQSYGYWGYQASPEGVILNNPRAGIALPAYREPEPSLRFGFEPSRAPRGYGGGYGGFGDDDYDWTGGGFVNPGDGIERF